MYLKKLWGFPKKKTVLGKQESESLADAGKVRGYTKNTIVIDDPVDLLHALAECEAK